MKSGILGLFWVAVVWGQTPADPPARVARLSMVEGAVSFRADADPAWAAATLNYPLTTGDHLWTAENSFAEIRIATMAIHLAPQAAFTLSYLDDAVAQVSLSQGSAYISLPVLDPGQSVEVDTPNAAISLAQAGAYRIDVDPEHNATSITVRSGEADLTANGRQWQVRPGRLLQVVGGQEITDTMAALPPDDWERSCAARDDAAAQALAQSEDYVPAEMEGAEDLSANGSWSVDAEFGALWIPNVGADWQPYLYGHWAYVAPWGWTWIDDAPWGFAPFHYGRWLLRRGHWTWVPGKRNAPPVYSPALVSFVHPRLSAPGRVAAWIPLAPGEPYRPHYTASQRYFQRVNAASAPNAANATEDVRSLANRVYIVAARRETIAAGQPVRGGAVRLPQEVLAGSQPGGIEDLRPAPVRRAPAAAPPQAAESRRVITRRGAPAVPTPLPPPSAPSRNAADQQRQVEQQREAEQQRQAEQQRTDQQRQTDGRRAEQQRQMEAQRQAEQQRQADVQRQAEQQRQAEVQRQAEQQRQAQQRAEQQRQIEAQRQAEQQRQAESQRQAQQRAEQQRQAEAQRVEQQRQIEAQRQAEQQRQAEAQRQAQQRAEQQRQAEAQRAEQQRQIEAQRQAEQQRAEEQRRQEEQRRAEEAKKKGGG